MAQAHGSDHPLGLITTVGIVTFSFFDMWRTRLRMIFIPPVKPAETAYWRDPEHLAADVPNLDV